jgi:ATP phosphoribosyltransferase
MPIKIALPKGRLLAETAQLAAKAGWQLSDYSEGARLYNLTSACFPGLSGKILHEKDIPVQVALGNYDLGICGLDWVQELVSKYPASLLIKVADLGYGEIRLYLAASQDSQYTDLSSAQASDEVISIASEYPNLAESLALTYRIKRFNIFPVWGAAEIYPPENADLVLLSTNGGRQKIPANLMEVSHVMSSTAYLIANQNSLESKDLSEVLNTLVPYYSALVSTVGRREKETPIVPAGPKINITRRKKVAPAADNRVWLALPDGHAQKHVINILEKAGIKIKDYPSLTGSRTPEIDLVGVHVKVIRPQDMPLQVSNRKFDIAITGRDWVREHLYQFPSSPVIELADLKYSKVRIVAAVHNDLPVNDIAGLRELAAARGWRLRLASEYTRIADKYARDNHLGVYRIIPTWGATEAFLPDDADILIENTETGSTLKRHNLKIIETLFESTACLIGNRDSLSSTKAARIRSIAGTLVKAV